mmetsp:Transcript_12693/g.17639  ORF Transcript_12693/g.17639 Transcript_12693/m.17639 type:complete len:111 (+) Transcript_12693:89-421(+)
MLACMMLRMGDTIGFQYILIVTRSKFFCAYGKAERLELDSIPVVKFVLKLHPMKTKSMQKALEKIHAQKHSNRGQEPNAISGNDKHRTRSSNPVLDDELRPKHFRKLRVS